MPNVTLSQAAQPPAQISPRPKTPTGSSQKQPQYQHPHTCAPADFKEPNIRVRLCRLGHHPHRRLVKPRSQHEEDVWMITSARLMGSLSKLCVVVLSHHLQIFPEQRMIQFILSPTNPYHQILFNQSF